MRVQNKRIHKEYVTIVGNYLFALQNEFQFA